MPADIAELLLRLRIVFFREQADIVAHREQPLEKGACFGVSMLQRVIVASPTLPAVLRREAFLHGRRAHLRSSNRRQASSIKTSFTRPHHQRRSPTIVVVNQELRDAGSLEIRKAENPYEVARLNSGYANVPVQCHAACEHSAILHPDNTLPLCAPSILRF